MDNQRWLEVVSVSGSLLSFIGVIVAIVQIIRTRRAAEAARTAAQITQQSISRNVILVDVANCNAQLEEIMALVRGKRYEAALLRVTDVSTSVTQLRAMNRGVGKQPVNFKHALTQLGILRDLLELRLHDDTTIVNPVKINSVLSDLSESLNHWIGSTKYVSTEDRTNG